MRRAADPDRAACRSALKSFTGAAWRPPRSSSPSDCCSCRSASSLSCRQRALASHWRSSGRSRADFRPRRLLNRYGPVLRFAVHHGVQTMSVVEAVGQLAPSFSGTLLQPTDPGYDEARRVHNGLIDKRPSLVARCHGTADVADAVRLARQLNLEVAVRGGGHNVAGRATIDGGLMIDLQPMKGVYVNPAARRVVAQGGVLWKELNRETQVHGLATTGGVVGSTGIAGLTLGGGLGWLMPKYGLALDNLTSAELVMADGSVRRASAKDDADLFWAIRGGGGNFGITTSLEYQLHNIGPMIAGGLVAHPFQRAAETLKFFRDTCRTLPDEMMMVAGLLFAPDGSGHKLCGMLAAHSGS